MDTLLNKIRITVFANDLDAFVPEVWAAESLMILHENVVAAKLVHTDFSNEVAQAGDVINTRRPAKFTSKRKVDTDDVTDQDATATNVAVKLDQHHHVSFVIKDGEETKGFKNLRDTYLAPAMQAVAQGIDEAVIGQKYEFLPNLVSQLGVDATISSIIDAGVKMDENLAPSVGRNMIVSPKVQGQLQAITAFHEADKVGDDGSALREGSLGRKFGFQTHMSQNSRSVTASDVVTGAINDTTSLGVGATVFNVDGFSAAIVPGTWCTIAGDMTPQLITAVTGGGTPTEITITPGTYNAVTNNAVVTVYDPALVNLSAGYAAGWVKPMVIDDITLAPRVGQLVSQGVTASALRHYGAMSTPTATEVEFNRAVETALADDDVLGLGPAGEYTWAFHRNAVALVTRPLAAPASGTGALSFVADSEGLSVRVTITYDGKAQGHRVTVDLLGGVKTLDTNLGCLILG